MRRCDQKLRRTFICMKTRLLTGYKKRLAWTLGSWVAYHRWELLFYHGTQGLHTGFHRLPLSVDARRTNRA